MKIGIMGGTFDPIHNGHLMIAEYAYRQYGLDEIWFLPNGNPPHKDNPDITRAKERVEMIKLAIRPFPYFRLNTYESDRKEKSYSYQTLEYFRKNYPEHEFSFIIGADSLLKIETWVHPEKIIRCMTILAACRDDMDSPREMYQQIHYLNEKYQGDIRFLQTPLLAVSSYEIREKIRKGQLEQLELPESVFTYILEKELYTKE